MYQISSNFSGLKQPPFIISQVCEGWPGGADLSWVWPEEAVFHESLTLLLRPVGSPDHIALKSLIKMQEVKVPTHKSKLSFCLCHICYHPIGYSQSCAQAQCQGVGLSLLPWKTAEAKDAIYFPRLIWHPFEHNVSIPYRAPMRQALQHPLPIYSLVPLTSFPSWLVSLWGWAWFMMTTW